MITIYDKGGSAYFIRPCPLINISRNNTFNENGSISSKYDITLTGSLLDNNGSPIFTSGNRLAASGSTSTWAKQYYPKPPQQNNISSDMSLQSILDKQVALTSLFSKDCIKIEVCSVKEGETEPVIVFYPKFLSISFGEGIWIQKCDYTINLEAPFILDRTEKVIGSEDYGQKDHRPSGLTVEEILNKFGGFVEDFQESWSLEPEEGNGNTANNPDTEEHITKVYRLTRNLSAKGKNLLGYAMNSGQLKPYLQAKNYIYKYIDKFGVDSSNDYGDYFGSGIPTQLGPFFGSGFLNLHSGIYGGYNHSRSENFDVTQGTYGIQDTWILSSGNAFENYSLSLSSNSSDSRNKVSLEGTIKGLTSIPSSGTLFGGNFNTSLNTPYENAINKYRSITNSGQFGLTAHTYKRAQNSAGGITLNHIPLSVTLSTNEFTGDINYTIEYDDRPHNLISGVISENISVTDTYPGDVFAVIPVIGRPTGPVLQYIGGRTEYQRAFSLEIIVDKPSGSNHRINYLQKPSLYGPTSTGIRDAILAYSPAREPGIRKYFVSPPQETWDPREGRYSLTINWTYELNY